MMVGKFLYHLHSSLIKLSGTDVERPELEALGWDELVARKRKLGSELKTLTDKIVELDKNHSQKIGTEIRDQRSILDGLADRQKQLRVEIDAGNAALLAVSEKISQSKNFLSLMEARLPAEKEEELQETIKKNQAQVDSKDYKSEREKNEILSRVKDATMKQEAIKAVRTIREQLALLTQESTNINSSIMRLNEERDSIRVRIVEINGALDGLYNSKRQMAGDRDSSIGEYDVLAKQFDAINARLDVMGEMRRKQREEYGHGLPSDALFKAIETARKKLQSGEKLSFDELKLLYGEKD
jgi:uncharacterized coiled-coil DUF342 family protein